MSSDQEDQDNVAPAGDAFGELTRRRFVGAALLGLGALALPRCGGDGGEDQVAEAPQRGGTLRVGVLGGGSSESVAPPYAVNQADYARVFPIFEPLVRLGADGELENVLAEELTPNADGSVWTIRLVEGVSWHNGKPFTADDVVYTVRWHLTTRGHYAIQAWDGVRDAAKVDKSTVRIELEQPDFAYRERLTEQYATIFPDGTTFPTNFSPIGTGPFRFVEWVRGQRAKLRRFENYRESGRPFLNELEIISINDPSARFNALASNQVDVITQVPTSLASEIRGNSELQLIAAHGGFCDTFVMDASKPPFSDVRVRQAMRLLIDRELILSNAYNGFGKLGNDLTSWFDPNYASNLPQRRYDPEQARSLLKQAGQEGLTAVLNVGDVTETIVSSATLFSQSASKGGVTLTVKKHAIDSYWPNIYLKVPFFVEFWRSRPAYLVMTTGYGSESVYNDGNWKNARFDALYNEIRTTRDADQRKQLMIEAQTIVWEEGALIFPGFLDFLVGASKKVRNIPKGVNDTLSNYDLRNVYLKT